MKPQDVVCRAVGWLELPPCDGVIKEILNDTMVLVDFGENYWRAIPWTWLRLVQPAGGKRLPEPVGGR